MTLRVLTLVLLGVALAVSSAIADDLAELKATEELRLKTVNDGKHTTRAKLIHDEFLRFVPQYPFPINRAKSESPRPDDGTPIRGERHNVYPIDYQYRVVGETGIVWG